MIRPLLSFGFSKLFPVNRETLVAPLNILSIRFFSDNKVRETGKKRFIFSEEEAKRGPEVGTVQSCLSWGEGEIECETTQKEQVKESIPDSKLRSQNCKKIESYLEAIRILEGFSDLKQEERESLRHISCRVNREYKKIQLN